MSSVVITIKIMPDSPDANLERIKEKASGNIADFGGKIGKMEFVPVAFGLKSVNIMFVMDENKGSTEELEKKLSSLENVNSAEIIDVRRTIG